MNGFARDEIEKARGVMAAMSGDAVLVERIEAVGARCAAAIRAGGKIMFCGNGGSAADSQHLAAELVGKLQFARPGLPAVSLTTDSSALTAIGNDFGYDQIFSRQLEAIGRPGDVLIGISTSGRSANVLRAFARARELGIATVGMTGNGPGAAEMSPYADILIRIPSNETQKIQEGHIVVGHIFCALVEAEIFGPRG